MTEIPRPIFWIALCLTLAIHAALAAGMAFQTSGVLRTIPDDKRRIDPRLSWLLVIPIFNVLWIWILLIQTSRSFNALHPEGRSCLPLAIVICSLYSILFIVLDPNWAWVVALLVFIPYKKRILKMNAATTLQ
jgi:hypothetical protein